MRVFAGKTSRKGRHLYPISRNVLTKGTQYVKILKMKFKWENDKNELLKQHRNISFEQMILSIEDKKVVDVIEHPNQKKYKGLIFILVEHNNYIYVVPSFISNSGDECQLKTIYPSRKYTDKYLRGKK